ncbi:MAG: Serine-protein kinase RsbW [Candidatus Angelobacter sp.]|jgi:serine/threonine-protein kinase RsbW|nr:Serine-protein kinase RsbW [Candidatus Angelobacter sp.]
MKRKMKWFSLSTWTSLRIAKHASRHFVDNSAHDRHTKLFPLTKLSCQELSKQALRQETQTEPPYMVTMANRVAYTLDSTLDSVNKVEQTAEQLAVKVGFSEDDLHKITMSVREAAVNAVLHGNAYDPSKKIMVAYESSPNTLAITITDEGKGLSEEEVPDPLAEENLLKTSGRGIFLIKSFMDEVRIRDLHPGTEITLVKHVHSSETDAKEQ